MPVINLYTLQTETRISRSEDVGTAHEALVLNGYVGTSPDSPSLAVSISTLELYRRIRLRKASFSVEAFAKVICDMYQWPYRRRYRTALSGAFDMYLSILRGVDVQVKEALGRNTDRWRARYSCPPCGYEVCSELTPFFKLLTLHQLNDEPALVYRRLMVFDGNNSLSRMTAFGDRKVADTRTFASDYFLDAGYVDKFADEVRSTRDSDDADISTADVGPISSCTDSWKAAAADAKKRSWGIFEETGIFASACRHGLIIYIIDMLRSGELFKYPLATVSKALDVLGGRLLVAYDIGCKLSGTIRHSSLASRFVSSGSRMCVDAFHGYAHEYSCQDAFHPTGITGAGLDDFGVMERIFSCSNEVAPVTRHASAYNRRLFIDVFFTQWDQDRYLNLGNYLYRSYKRAVNILADENVALAHAKSSLQVSDEDLRTWRAEQTHYLRSVGEEAEYDIHAVAYVEALQKLRDSRAASSAFLNTDPLDISAFTSRKAYEDATSRTAKLETARRVKEERDAIVTEEVNALEVKLGIRKRWEPSNPEYIAAAAYLNNRKYHQALNNLQRLVVLRLLELHKQNVGRSGQHIAKSLQTRCKAIQNAIKTYNTAAHAIGKPALDWSKVSNYSFLEEFTLLRESRDDIRAKRWTQPVIRELMKQSLRVERAKEEVVRLNVEVRRLHTFIVDEKKQFTQVLADLERKHDPVHGAVLEFCRRRRRVNARLMERLEDVFALEGFSGSREPGVSANNDAIVLTHDPILSTELRTEETSGEVDKATNDDKDGDDDEGSEADDERLEEVGVLVDYYTNLQGE
ncbi:hypothetical protein CONPUDRAFT_49671 [Coniophora puteana RWD-64-598 SS2]|uniref:CxC1-like cysteine cluster associated with KDZ transposases domain-containing protein n=1 Tax=Coniophora puteana (strain RWD-64-598) TaxID=741705 RepID=A0A5M3N024_CONPW|nr:uncharacterized protein CONPUDRAFT_49671 [Coniophora puteana RWD-64-598 SS2]EIW84255.1 hypothetical protein CONPUDRAFT_49671 [Coniophora puteana RWD-64-598 SS2]